MIITENDLRKAALDGRNKSFSHCVLLESMKFDDNKTYDLFISHSFSDKELVKGLYYKFSAAGYSVYVDWIEDFQLDRCEVNEKTAELLRTRIRKCEGLAYVATSSTPSSKWCPWELGLSDGITGKVCILPIIETEYRGQEYLGLYPFLAFCN